MDLHRLTCIKLGEVPKPYLNIYFGMAIDPKGMIYVSDTDKLRQLDADGNLLQEYAYSGHTQGVKVLTLPAMANFMVIVFTMAASL